MDSKNCTIILKYLFILLLVILKTYAQTTESESYEDSEENINILMQYTMALEFSPLLRDYARNKEIKIKITSVSDDLDMYFNNLHEYFDNEDSLWNKFDGFILPGLFVPNFLDNLDTVLIDQRDDSDIYSGLDYYVNFKDKPYGYTLSSQFHLLYYRKDFVLHEPTTWEDLAGSITSNKNKDFNGDGVIDTPSCIPSSLLDNHQLHDYFYTILSPMLQTNGTSEGIFFHKNSFEPLIKNFAFQLALQTLSEIVEDSIPDIETARKKFLAGECVVFIDQAEFGKVLTDYYSSLNDNNGNEGKKRTIRTNFFSDIAVRPTPGSNNVYLRSKDQIVNCRTTNCTFASSSVYNTAPFILGGWVGTINERTSLLSYTILNDLYRHISSSYQSSLEVTQSVLISPYRHSHLTSPSWQRSRYHQLEGYTSAINSSLANPNLALDLRVPYNFDFIRALEAPISDFIADPYIDPYETSNIIFTSWNAIISDISDRVDIQSLYILSLVSIPFPLPFSSDKWDSSSTEDEGGSLLGLIIALPIAGGVSLCLLLLCIILILGFIAIAATHRKRHPLDDNYQPAWAIDFDEIELKRKIGAGSFGDVYQGVYRGTNVAVKIPREKISDKDQFIKFFDEISIMRDLRHPNVLLFMGARIQSPNQCIVTEYMPRGSLYDILHDESIVLDWMLIQTMALDAAQGMDFLHSASPPILHRDFKSPNLLVDKKWNLKVADFGLTKFQRNSVVAGNQKAVGSIFWTAPEVLRDPESYTKKSDVYSYGIVLWELLTRSDPYQGMNPLYVALAVMDDNLRPPIPPNWHGDVVELLNDCWNENPDRRPSFSEIRERLELMEMPFEMTNNGQGNFSVSPFASNYYPSNEKLVAPKGIITFLFTDIKGYGTLWEQFPLLMHKAVQIHNQIIRFVSSEYGGYEVKSESDSFMIAFQEAENAIMAAVSIQEELMKAPWPKTLITTPSTREERDNDGKLIFRGLRVRIGINSGAAYSTTDIVTGRADYFGNSVNRAAQVTGLCEAGEVLLTPNTIKQLGDVDSLSIGPFVHFSKSHLTVGKKNKPIYRVLPLALIKRTDFFRDLHNSGGDLDRKKKNHKTAQKNDKDGDISKQPWVIDFSEITLGKKIGAGTFGEVYKAKWKGSDVAVKKFFKQQANEQMLLELRKESVIMSQLRHPNILLFLGACINPPNLCIVTEYLKFGSVAGILHNKSINLTFHQKIKYLKGAARGMCYLHGRKPAFIHRDLTSYNLLVGDNNTVKIGDFGLSRIKESNATMTLCGTAAWTAPEILQGLEYSEKSDIYSFGIIMWECFTRRLPFKGMDMIKISKLVTKGARPAIPPNCPELYQQLMTSCWQTNPESRPSFDVILNQLKEISKADIKEKSTISPSSPVSQNKLIEVSDDHHF